MKKFMAGVLVTLLAGAAVTFALPRLRSSDDRRFDTSEPLEQTMRKIVGARAVDVGCYPAVGRIWRCDVATEIDKGATYKVRVSADERCFSALVNDDGNFAAAAYRPPDPKLPERVNGWFDQKDCRPGST